MKYRFIVSLCSENHVAAPKLDKLLLNIKEL